MMLFFSFPVSATPPGFPPTLPPPSTRVPKLPSSISLLTVSLESTVKHLSSCIAHFQLSPARRLTQRNHLMARPSKSSSGQKQEGKNLPSSGTELLALLALLALPFTQPLVSSSPSFKRVSYPPQSVSLCHFSMIFYTSLLV